MLIRRLFTMTLVLGPVLSMSCGGDDKTGTKTGGVGSACASDASCVGYAKPSCLTELRPVEDLVSADSGSAGALFRTLTLPFPGGYCSNTIEDSCATDADCGKGAGCYRPFDGVSDQTITALNTLVPFDLREFASRGLCFQTCAADADCRTDQDYKCVVPLHDFVDVINPEYTKTFCIQDIDVTYLLVGGDGGS